MAITFTPIPDSDPIELIISGSPGGIFDGHVVSASVLLDGSTGQIATFGAGGGSGSGGGLAVTDQAAFIAGSSSLTPTGGVYNDGLATLATPGQQGLVRITPNRALHLNLRRQDGTETGTSTTPLVTSGTIAQGAAAAITVPWSVALSDGTNLLGTTTHPVNVNPGDLTSASDSIAALGNVASLAADSGNPVKVGGVYNTTAPAPTNGQRVDLQTDNHANLQTNLNSLLAGEDQTYNIMNVQARTKYTQMIISTAVKSSPGYLKGIFVASASATPTIKVWDSTAASGATLIDTFTPVAATKYDFDWVTATTGIYVALSGTVDCTVFWQ